MQKDRRKCTAALFAPKGLVEQYNNRFALVRKKVKIKNIIICISGDGHIRVLQESERVSA